MNLNSLSAGTLILALATPSLLPAQDARREASYRPTMDIVDTAAKAGTFQTLLTAAKAAGLVGTLKSEGPFTIFAPTTLHSRSFRMGRSKPS